MDNNSFYSIDRLVEFGLGMSIAQQMVGMMNQSMQTMQMPGGLQGSSQEPRMYYVAPSNNAVGPLSERDLAQMVLNHQVTKDTLAWMPGMTGWKPVEQVPAILRVIALTPPPLQQPRS